MKKKTIVINIHGGPSTGKTTLALGLTSKLKLSAVDVELVPEYIKKWVYEGKKIERPEEQIYIFAKQAKAEIILYNKVDVVITDSPLWLPAFYEFYYQKDQNNYIRMMESFTKDYMKNIHRENKIVSLNFALSVLDSYQQVGRWQTKEEAIIVHNEMINYIQSQGVNMIHLPKDQKSREEIIITELKKHIEIEEN